MKLNRTALMLSTGIAFAIAKPATGHAQTTTIVTPVPVAAPVAAEKNVLPNPPMLASGLTSLVVGYIPALGVAITSDHKGDDHLYVPVVGPWLDMGNRNCSGITVPTSNGPFEVSSQKSCGSSGIETAALIADGAVQGLGALQIIGSLFIPQRRVTVVGDSGHPSFSVTPTSFGGHGAGAVAAGHF